MVYAGGDGEFATSSFRSSGCKGGEPPEIESLLSSKTTGRSTSDRQRSSIDSKRVARMLSMLCIWKARSLTKLVDDDADGDTELIITNKLETQNSVVGKSFRWENFYVTGSNPQTTMI
jgi:hypothetical protein